MQKEGMRAPFRDLISYYASKDLEFDLVCGDADCSFTFSFCGELKYTPYCEQKYSKLLDAEAYVIFDTTGRFTDSIVIEDESVPFDMGEAFAAAVAGYVSEKEYDKLFK